MLRSTAFRCAALLDDKGPALIGNAVQKLAEIRARTQRGNYDAAGLWKAFYGTAKPVPFVQRRFSLSLFGVYAPAN
jgi:hypothetical protein